MSLLVEVGVRKLRNPMWHRIYIEFEKGRNNPGCFDETVIRGWEVEKDGCRLGIEGSCGCMCFGLDSMSKATSKPSETWDLSIH